MTTRTVFAASVALAAALLAGCAPGEVSDSELDRYLCSPDDLGADYQELIRGDFTPRDLAHLGEDEVAIERAYREAGMGRGKFVFYKSVLPRPPFEPPVNVVCQVMEFASDSAARDWVAGLEAEAAATSLALGRIPEEGRVASEATSAVREPAGPRTFLVAGGSGESRTAVVLLVGAQGRYARVIAAGTAAESGPPSDLVESLWTGPAKSSP